MVFEIIEEQRIAPIGSRYRFEGIAFSPDGASLAVATSEANALLFYRHADGRLAEEPFATVAGPRSRLEYPHDIAFSAAGDLMAVAQRRGAIAIYEGSASEPAFVIRGSRTRLNFSDGVAFVPPADDCLAVCNLESDSVSFYRMTSRSPLAFELRPSLELKGAPIYQPDGLAFSSDGRWLAVANHGNHTVAVFDRSSGGSTLIRNRSFRFPHSVAFTPDGDHLLVTNAGANYFSVIEYDGRKWSPAGRHIVGPDRTFREVNARCKSEGGPKGIAIHGDRVAICSPEQGIVMYALRERRRPLIRLRHLLPR